MRLVLHRGDPDLNNVTADDVEAMRDAVRTLDQIPGIDDVLDPRRIQTLKGQWGTSVFRTGVTLFHAGITDRLPARLASQAATGAEQQAPHRRGDEPLPAPSER